MKFARYVFAAAMLARTLPLFAASAEILVGGTVASPAPGPRGFASIATDGTDFLVVWSDGRSENSIVGTRVKSGGQVLDPLGIHFDEGGAPQVVWDGNAYVVIWSRSGNVWASRMDRDGHFVTEAHVIAVNGFTTSSRYAASNGNVTVVVYHSNASWKYPPAWSRSIATLMRFTTKRSPPIRSLVDNFRSRPRRLGSSWQ